jgi:hypothetical protein
MSLNSCRDLCGCHLFCPHVTPSACRREERTKQGREDDRMTSTKGQINMDHCSNDFAIHCFMIGLRLFGHPFRPFYPSLPGREKGAALRSFTTYV